MTTLKRPKPKVTLKRNIEDIVKNVDSKFGDVYLVSEDRRYFLAHKIILVLFCPLLKSQFFYKTFFMIVICKNYANPVPISN